MAALAATAARLAGCMALRFSEPGDELWRVAAGAFADVVYQGLGAANLAAPPAQQVPVPADTWRALADAYEAFLLGAGPAGRAVAAAAAAGTAAAGAAPAGGAEEMEVVAPVLDTLTDVVLTSCAQAPPEVRARLVGVVHRASLPPEGEAAGQLQLICLRKLSVLCARGSSASSDGGARCLLEVAQAALPCLLERARAVLQQYAAECDAPGSQALSRASSSSAAAPQPPEASTPSAGAQALGRAGSFSSGARQRRVEEVRTLLSVLIGLELDPAVVDAAAGSNPVLSPWLAWVGPHSAPARGARGAACHAAPAAPPPTGGLPFVPPRRPCLLTREAPPPPPPPRPQVRTHLLGYNSRRERTHLLPLYPLLVACVTSGNEQVRRLARDALAAVGQQIGLDMLASGEGLSLGGGGRGAAARGAS